MLQHARYYRAIDISVIALRERSKEPAFAWREYARRLATDVELVRWFPAGTQRNVGAVMGAVSGLVAIDADSRESAQELRSLLPDTPMRTRTRQGEHFLFQLPVGLLVPPAVKTLIRGVLADVRGERSYVVLGGSTHPSGDRYQRVGAWDRRATPFFDPSWLEANDQQRRERTATRRSSIRDIDRYLSRVESIQGNRGSAGLVRACHLCREARLSAAEATLALVRWNRLPVVRPLWSETELARAVTRVYEEPR